MQKLSDYNFSLPENLIAQKPILPLENTRLLIFKNGEIFDDKVLNISKYLPSCLMITNTSKVVNARVILKNVKIKKHTGVEKIIESGEIFFLHKIDDHNFEGLLTLDKRTRPGIKIFLDDIILEITHLTDQGVIFCCNIKVDELLDKFGQMPLPPYIENDQSLARNYQNPFASQAGSVASPTASLHFSEKILDSLKKNNIEIENIVLHIGLGTFKPVFEDNIKNHTMHSEKASININLFEKIFLAKKNGKQIFAIGTTVARVLESMSSVWQNLATKQKQIFDSEVQNFWNQKTNENIIKNLILDGETLNFETNIFLYPGKNWQIVDILKTNFHLPASSLLMLVASYVGYENMKKIYEFAINNNFRFYSFGDTSLLFKN